MITTYAQNSHWDVALGFFHKMQIVGLKSNVVTIATTHTTYANYQLVEKLEYNPTWMMRHENRHQEENNPYD